MQANNAKLPPRPKLRFGARSYRIWEYGPTDFRLEKSRIKLETFTTIEAAKADMHRRIEEAAKANAAEKTKRSNEAMHCQCCGRDILANTGIIAHHGYERPGSGWQTGSCMGARYVPFEVSRVRLGEQIDALKRHRTGLRNTRAGIAKETDAIYYSYTDYSAPRDYRGRHPEKRVNVTRENFEQLKTTDKQVGVSFTQRSISDFDKLKERELAGFDYKIKVTTGHINHDQKRFDGWKQTHEWRNEKWMKL